MSIESSVHCYCRTGYGVLVEVGNHSGAPGASPCLVDRARALKPLGAMRGSFILGAHRVLGRLAEWLATVRKAAA